MASPYRETEKYNPVTSLLYRAMEEQGAEVQQFTSRRLILGSWDVWHLHWPELLLGPSEWLPWKLAKFWMKLKIARAKGVRVVWTVHNLHPHEARHPFFLRLFWRILLPNIDGMICMTKSGQARLHEEHPEIRGRPVFIIPHGDYRGVYPDNVTREEARRMLGIGAGETVVAFIGMIRTYKGVPHLIRCFNTAALPASHLVIAGEPFEDFLVREIHEAVSGRQNITPVLQFVAEEKMQLYLRAADLISLPYGDILNSGTALLALSFDRPILVPNRGAMGELYEAMGPAWVRLYDGDLTPQTLRDAMIWAGERQMDGRGSAPLEAFGWDRIAKSTMAAFASL